MIRRMEIADLEQVVDIDAQSFPIAWNKAQYTYELVENEFAYLYVLETSADGIVAFIDFWITFEICQLAKIAVLPTFRQHHYARELMNTMIQVAEQEGCENISLEVRTSNTIAHRLYEQFSFIKVNERKQYYQDNGENADVLIKVLGGYTK